MRPPRCVPRNRQRRPAYASGVMSCAAHAMPASSEIARIRMRAKLFIERNGNESGLEAVTNLSTDVDLNYLSFWLAHGSECIISCNQTRAAAECQVLKSPLNKNHDSALKFHDINQVDEQPDQPREQARKMKTKNVRDCGGTPDYRHVALIEIMKWGSLRLFLDR